MRYTTTIHLDKPAGPDTLDFGRFGEVAQVSVNGQAIAELLWAPCVATVPECVLAPGGSTVEVLVGNSAADHYEGLRADSGLMGPVLLSPAAGYAGARALTEFRSTVGQ